MLPSLSPSYFLNDDPSGSADPQTLNRCVECLDGMDCSASVARSANGTGRTTFTTALTAEGFWRATPDSSEFLSCYTEAFCVGGPYNNSCREGHEGEGDGKRMMVIVCPACTFLLCLRRPVLPPLQGQLRS